MTHDATIQYDITHDMTTYLMIWHDDIDVHENVEPCRKSYACGIKIPTWVELSLNQVSLYNLV